MTVFAISFLLLMSGILTYLMTGHTPAYYAAIALVYLEGCIAQAIKTVRWAAIHYRAGVMESVDDVRGQVSERIWGR